MKKCIVPIKSLDENLTAMTNIFFRSRKHGSTPGLTARKNVILYQTDKINPDPRKSLVGVRLI
jgi:hypothetical protein